MKKIVCLLLSLLLTACYKSSPYDPSQRADYYSSARESSQGRNRLPLERPEQEGVQQARKLPWEVWATGRDLAGAPIANTDLLKGDTYAQEGLRAQALVHYKRIDLNKIAEHERAAVVYRIAAMELAADKPQAALAVLGWFAERSKMEVSEVNPFFGLLMAYAYARNNEIAQSFAWFSKINLAAAGQGSMSQAANSGMNLLVRSIPDQDLEKLSGEWTTDSFVSTQLGQEQRRRQQSGIRLQVASTTPFWIVGQPEAVAIKADSNLERARIAVLLPLTGQYASLGQATKRGIELGFKGSGIESTASIEYRDTAGDRVQAIAVVEELALSRQPVVILGPLLAVEAQVVADLARKKSLPVLTLTKNSDFYPGDGVFRLGPTAKSQVESILEAAYNDKQIREFGFIYTNEPQSKELIAEARIVLERWGLAPIYEVAYTRGDQNALQKIAAQIENQPMEAIFFTDDITAATRLRFMMRDVVRQKTLFLGTARWDVPDQLRQSAKALEGCMFVSPYFVFSDNPFVKQFQQTYAATYGHQPEFLAAQGFDAATLLSAAYTRSQGLRRSFVDSMSGIDLYKGLTGEIAVMHSGEVQRKFTVVEVGPQGLQPALPAARKVFTGQGEHEYR